LATFRHLVVFRLLCAAVVAAGVRRIDIPAAGRRVGVILSGGNVDLSKLPWGSGK